MTSSEVGSLRSMKRRKCAVGAVDYDDNDDDNDNEEKITPDIEGKEYDTKQPLYVMFEIYTKVIDALHPFSLLTRVKDKLSGYRDCVEKGPNSDATPPPDLREGEDYYRWESWRDCTAALRKKTWTPNKFKEAAIKKYIAISRKYLLKVVGQAPQWGASPP